MLCHGVPEHLGRVQPFETDQAALRLVRAEAAVPVLALQHEPDRVAQRRRVRCVPVGGEKPEDRLGGAVGHRPAVPSRGEAPAAAGVLPVGLSIAFEADADLLPAQVVRPASERIADPIECGCRRQRLQGEGGIPGSASRPGDAQPSLVVFPYPAVQLCEGAEPVGVFGVAQPQGKDVQHPADGRYARMVGGLKLPPDAADDRFQVAGAQALAVQPVEEACETEPGAEPQARPRVQVGVSQAIAAPVEIGAGEPVGVQLFPDGGDQGCDGRLEPMCVHGCHPHVDEPCMAVPVRWMQRHPARQAPHFRQHGIDAAPVVEIQERQPELAPTRDPEDPLFLQEPPRRFDQRVFPLDAEQSGRDVDQCSDEQAGRFVLVEAPQASFEAGPSEVAQHAAAADRPERTAEDMVQQHVLRGEHGAPEHLAFEAAILSLEVQQALGCHPQGGMGIRVPSHAASHSAG